MNSSSSRSTKDKARAALPRTAPRPLRNGNKATNLARCHGPHGRLLARRLWLGTRLRATLSGTAFQRGLLLIFIGLGAANLLKAG